MNYITISLIFNINCDHNRLGKKFIEIIKHTQKNKPRQILCLIEMFVQIKRLKITFTNCKDDCSTHFMSSSLTEKSWKKHFAKTSADWLYRINVYYDQHSSKSKLKMVYLDIWESTKDWMKEINTVSFKRRVELGWAHIGWVFVRTLNLRFHILEPVAGRNMESQL